MKYCSRHARSPTPARRAWGSSGRVIHHRRFELIRRHPHVFSDTKLKSSNGRRSNEPNATKSDSILAGIPASLPSLLRAHQIQKRASRTGFDWETSEQVLEKLDELEELRAAASHLPVSEPSVQQPNAAVEHELGDVLFTIVNMARFLRINPEEALRKANNRFIARFQYMERHGSRGKSPPGDDGFGMGYVVGSSQEPGKNRISPGFRSSRNPGPCPRP